MAFILSPLVLLFGNTRAHRPLSIHFEYTCSGFSSILLQLPESVLLKPLVIGMNVMCLSRMCKYQRS